MTNIATNEMLAKVVAKIKAHAEAGTPLTLQMASVIRAEGRTSRAIELGNDAPLTVADCLTMEWFIGEPGPVAPQPVTTTGVGVQSKQPKFPGWRTMTSAQRRNAKMEAMFERARQQGHTSLRTA